MKISTIESGEPPLDSEGPFRFERRQFDRWSVDGVATAVEVGGAGFGRMHRLRLQDYSDAGIGAHWPCPSQSPTAFWQYCPRPQSRLV